MVTPALLAIAALAIMSLGFAATVYAMPFTLGGVIGYSESKITVVDKNTEPVGCTDDQMKATQLAVRDQNGNVITQTASDSQVLLQATIVNNCSLDQYVILIFEVRNAEGITNHLTWQIRTIDAKERFMTGTSWTAPEEPGTYEVRFFKISSLQSTSVLSQVLTYKLTVLPDY